MERWHSRTIVNGIFFYNPGFSKYKIYPYYFDRGLLRSPQSLAVATMTCLAVTEYLCHTLPRLYSVCRYHNSVLFSFMIYHRVSNKSNTTGASSGSRNCEPLRSTCFVPQFLVGICCSFCFVLCVLSVLKT